MRCLLPHLCAAALRCAAPLDARLCPCLPQPPSLLPPSLPLLQRLQGRDGEWIELANGCMCCAVKSDFVQALEKLLQRKDGFDYIIIETTGGRWWGWRRELRRTRRKWSLGEGWCKFVKTGEEWWGGGGMERY